jgi:hypothetical protein
LLAIGGRRVLHMSGPVLPGAALELLDRLDGRTSAEAAILRLAAATQEGAWRSYRALLECGLLRAVGPQAAATPWQLFAARYGDENAVPASFRIPDPPSRSPVTDAILRHARLAAAAGLPVSGTIETDMFGRMLARQKSDAITPARPIGSALAPHFTIASRILWPLVGCEREDGAWRWICPSAGDLRSTCAVVLRRFEGLAILELYESQSGAPVLIRSLGRVALPVELEPGQGLTCFLVSGLARLSVRYGPLAPDLAASDAGMAAALLARSAAAQGWSAHW